MSRPSHKSIDSIRTHSLIAERLRSDDLIRLCRMHQDVRVMATLGGLRSEEETEVYLRSNMEHWDSHGYGLWMLRTHAEGHFVGRAGLRNVLVDGADEIEVAYALVTDFWGKGLATEIVTRLLAIAISHLQIGDLVAFTLPTNLASRRVMEKAGFEFDRPILHAGKRHVLYRFRHCRSNHDRSRF